MYSQRTVQLALLVLAASAPWLTAEEPQPGKVRLVHWLKNPDEKPTSFSTDGRLLIVGNNPDASNYVRVWDPKVGKEIARCSLGNESALSIAFAPDGKTVACRYHMAKEICLFDVASGKLISSIPQPGLVRETLFAPDGKTLISRCDPGGLRLWDVKTGKELWQLRLRFPEKMPLPVDDKMQHHYWETHHGLAFSPDGKILAVGLQDSSIHLCNAATGAEIRRLFKPVSWLWVPHMAFSPDGHYLAAHAFEKFPGDTQIALPDRLVIRLWDVRNGELVREFKQPIPPMPDEKLLPFLTGKEKDRFFYKNKWDCSGLAFSPDGKTLANCSMVTRLWEVVTGRIRHEFEANASGGVFLRMVACLRHTIRPRLPITVRKGELSGSGTAYAYGTGVIHVCRNRTGLGRAKSSSCGAIFRRRTPLWATGRLPACWHIRTRPLRR